MSYKLRAYRVAGGATCPEAIIFYLLLYALLYILKHETWDGRVAANELHEIPHAMKPREVPSIVFRTFVSQGPVPVAGASSVS